MNGTINIFDKLLFIHDFTVELYEMRMSLVLVLNELLTF